MSILYEGNPAIAPLPFVTIGRLVNLTEQTQYNGHVCHSVQPDGTFQSATDDLRVSVYVAGAPKLLRIQMANIVPLPPRRNDNRKDELFTHETRLALRDGIGGGGGGGVDAEKKILYSILYRLPYIGGISVLIDEVVSYLLIKPVDPTVIRAVTASSVDDSLQSSISNTLDERRDRWWISQNSSCANGIGEEWVSYDLCPDSTTDGRARTAVKVEYFRLVIPPLPAGPLSVRKFRLEVSNTTGEKEGPWTAATDELVTLDSGEVQEWSIDPPIEARFVRIVCKENAASALGQWFITSIGFFTVGFL